VENPVVLKDKLAQADSFVKKVAVLSAKMMLAAELLSFVEEVLALMAVV